MVVYKKYNLLNTISHSLFEDLYRYHILVKSKYINIGYVYIIVSVISRFLLNDCLFYYVKKEKNVKKSLFEHQELNIDFILIIIILFLKIINAEQK